MKKKVLVIVGPTAVGKTAFGIQLAQEFDGEIISGDSQQVYRGLDIGTAKATTEERAIVPHHLIDIRELTENFSVFDFVSTASQLMEELLTKNKTPIVVGGTGLYIQALMEGYHLGGSKNHEAMMELRKDLSILTNADLLEEIRLRGLKVSEFNRRRAIRMLELSEFAEGTENIRPPYEFYTIGLTLPRDELYTRINNRVDKMLTAGLLDEAKMLYKNYRLSQAARGIGYKEFFSYFSGEQSLEETIRQIKQHTRHYAKRQLTWFRNRMNVEFINVNKQGFSKNVITEVKDFLSNQ